MSLQRQFLVGLTAFVGVILLLYYFAEVLLPFVAGMGLAFALDPAADWLERRGLSRLAATFLILVLFLIFLVVVLLAIVPILFQQLGELIANLPGMVERLQTLLTPLLDTRLAQSLGIDASTIRGSINSILGQGVGWATSVLGSVWVGGRALIAILSLLVITPVVGFYLLYDWDRMLGRLDSWLPRNNADIIRRLAAEIGQAISGFVRGQALVCLFLGLWYGAGLQLFNVNFGLAIGLTAGILSLIPFIGTLTGFVVAMIVATAQFWPNWPWIAAVAGVFVTGQFIEGYILQPRLVGGRVGLHPVWLMFALIAAGYVLGFMGLLIAVPLAAAVGVFVRHALRVYLASPLYSGKAQDTTPGAEGLTAERASRKRQAAGS